MKIVTLFKRSHKPHDRPEDGTINKLSALRPLMMLVNWVSEGRVSEMKAMTGEVEGRRDFKLQIAGSLLHPL